MRNMRPALLGAPKEIIKVKSTLVTPYSEVERKHLIELFKEVFDEKLDEDGDVFRLEGMDNGVLSVSGAKYSDLLLLDVVASRYKEWKEKTVGDLAASRLTTYIWEKILQNDKPLNKYRSNVLAMSCIIVDSEDKVLITQRSGDVTIGKNITSVSATGTCTGVDFEYDLGIGCARRRLVKDLNVDLDKCTFSQSGIYVGAMKKQPVILVDCKYDGDVDEIVGNAQKAVDYHHKIKYTSVHRLDTASTVLSMGGATEAAKYHMYNTITNILGGTY